MIPVSKPILSPTSAKLINEAISSGWISGSSPKVSEFEEKFAKYLGVKHALTTTSGTASLHLGLAALGIKSGDEVIVPAFSMVSPLFAVLYTGATPVAVDADEKTWNIDASKIEGKITKKTRAIIAVHTYGNPCDMTSILRLAKKYGVFVIEDGAEALGAEINGKKVGSFGDISCFSFYSNKTITTGEGGMVVTNSKRILEHAKSLKDMSHSKKKRFLHEELGFTYRMGSLQAALGISQLKNIKDIVRRKKEIAAIYLKMLRPIPGLKFAQNMRGIININWMFGLLVNKEFGKSRDYLSNQLLKRGVETRNFFIPANKQPVFAKMGLFTNEKYPVADSLSEKGIYIPSGPNITNAETKKVAEDIKKIYEM